MRWSAYLARRFSYGLRIKLQKQILLHNLAIWLHWRVCTRHQQRMHASWHWTIFNSQQFSTIKLQGWDIWDCGRISSRFMQRLPPRIHVNRRLLRMSGVPPIQAIFIQWIHCMCFPVPSQHIHNTEKNMHFLSSRLFRTPWGHVHI